MHIDHQKLVELVTETSGLDKSEVEEQLEKLVNEIKDAIAEGDAYELEGFGVFSGIGDNIIFLPNESLETEINYKYVGMEAIEMDSPDPSDEEDVSSDEAGEEDPFAGLLDELEDDIIEEHPVQPKEENEESAHIFEFDKDEADESGEPDEKEGEETDSEEVPQKPWGIDAHTDEEDRESNRRLFSGLLDDDEDEEEPVAKSTHGDKEEEAEPEEDDEFEAVFGQGADDSDEMDEFVEEMSAQLAPEEEAEDEGPEKDVPDEPEEVLQEEAEEEDPFEELAKSGVEETEEVPEKAADSEENAEITDDQEEQAAPKSEPKQEEPEPASEEEVVPVIKNLASERAKKARKEKAEKKEEKPKAETKKTPKREKEETPVWLWLVLIVLIAGIAVAGVGYTGWIQIPGITPETTTAQNQQVEVQQPEEPVAEEQPAQDAQQEESEQMAETEQQQQAPPENENNTQETSPAEEQSEEASVSLNEGEADIPAGQPEYGLMGQANPEANDGYTIVVYSLSNEDNARQRRSELSEVGYRVLLAGIPSSQYGTLWRVSLGQFETMRDAAIAAEELSEPLSDNYFITQIQ